MLQRTDDGLAYEDGRLELADGRVLAWRWWGESGKPILRFQGTPGSRLFRNLDPRIQQELGVRYLMADRPGYGASTRKPGRGIADFAEDIRALLDAQGLDRVPVMGTSGGGPHALAMAAVLPGRISAVSVIVGAAPLAAEEVARQVGVNAEGYALAEKGWEPLHEFLAGIRLRMLGEGMAGVLHDAPEADRAIMRNPAWQRLSRENVAEALRQGAEGWTDEALALHGDWDFDPSLVTAGVTWWHGDDDQNAPISAARRALKKLPHAELREWHG
ncbi:MAG TPA: alpha/beta hydrolase, partial [Patescibacteria group bacterium]|nr:alpha/beta hydrolase [Patescibacteria group bacterium]